MKQSSFIGAILILLLLTAAAVFWTGKEEAEISPASEIVVTQIPAIIPIATSSLTAAEIPSPAVEISATSTLVATSTSNAENLFSASSILLNVPFTSQAPFGNWDDMRQETGCEEASVLMAVRWVKGLELTLEEAEKEIIASSDYQLAKYGYFEDTSVQDTATRILSGYFGYENYEVRTEITSKDIITEIEKGNIVIVALAGQKLGNPFYTPPGPISHMMVVIGYDTDTKEFITNDPGTRHGEKFRYSENIFEAALRDYPSGDHEPITENRTAMIVIRKS